MIMASKLVIKPKSFGAIFVLYNENSPVGYAKMYIKHGYMLCNFQIRSRFRHHGLANCFLELIMKSNFSPKTVVAKPYGKIKIPKEKLITIYEKAGFKIVDSAYYHGVLMEQGND